MTTANLHRGPWTVDDVLAMPEDGYRYEILSPGVLTVSPSPGTAHQRASRRLANLLDAAGEPEFECVEAVSVELHADKLIVPDLLVVPAAVAAADPSRYVAADVHLAVEIVSPGSRAVDYSVKPALYAEAGIGAFWRLDLARHTLDLFAATGGHGYEQVGQITATARTTPTCASTPAGRIWAVVEDLDLSELARPAAWRKFR